MPELNERGRCAGCNGTGIGIGQRADAFCQCQTGRDLLRIRISSLKADARKRAPVLEALAAIDEARGLKPRVFDGRLSGFDAKMAATGERH
jgi:hypothetical protein